MKCRCRYYCIVNGELVCSVCGKPANSCGDIEDKMIEKHEDKQNYSTESRRIAKKSKRR